MASSSSSNSDLLTKEELEAIDYRHLLVMDKNYSFKISKKTKSTKKDKDSIIRRLLKNGVKRSKFGPELASYLRYELEHPIAKALPSGTFLPPYLVGEIYTMKEELEDRDYEMAFIKAIFEPTTRPQNFGAFFNFTINGQNVRLYMEGDNARFNGHVENLYSPNFFIKDYKYLVQRFGLNAKKLQEKGAYRDTIGHRSGRYGPQPPFTTTIPNRAIYDSYANFKRLHIDKFFYENVLAAYSMIIVIGDVITTIFNYQNSHYVPKYPQASANTALETRYLPRPVNKPVNVLKVYIKELNKLLLKLRGYKILLNPSIISDLNNRLDTLNEYLVEPDPSIVDQANAKFSIRILENGPKLPKKQRSFTPRRKSNRTTRRLKSF
uniref:Uncharacterized protein n=1 Tax=viral metagenome TaxID=1070528 RepID=A0A6C0D4U4_9ZZZZ